MRSTKPTYLSILLLWLLVLTGCAALRIYPSDDGMTVAAKSIARVVQCAITLCLSELDYSLMDERIASNFHAATYEEQLAFCRRQGLGPHVEWSALEKEYHKPASPRDET
jgi:hypothetical protein